MRLNDSGEPVIQGEEDQEKAAAFVERLARNLHGRLPKFAKMFLSVDALEALLAGAIQSMTRTV